MMMGLAARDRHGGPGADDDRRRLRALIAEMGGLVEVALARALASLRDHDDAGADAVIAGDPAVDALERRVGELVTDLIERRAPRGDDLREILAAYRIAGLIERIGDYAKTVARRGRAVELTDEAEPMRLVKSLGDGVRDLLRRALDAFAARDTDAAQAVCRHDRQVDDLYNALLPALLAHMQRTPDEVPAYSHLLFIAKSLERVGDQATNIAELVYHAATGEQMPDRFAVPQQPA